MNVGCIKFRLPSVAIPLRATFTFILILFVQSCVQIPKVADSQPTEQQPSAPIVYYPVFGERPELVSADDLFNLKKEQQKSFLQFFRRENRMG